MQVNAIKLQVDVIELQVDAIKLQVDVIKLQVDAIELQVDAIKLQVDVMRCLRPCGLSRLTRFCHFSWRIIDNPEKSGFILGSVTQEG
ncbi:hypothetical protein BV378_33410 [Nostoc sp. RF31YmG]|nr:hypothetical protein BV378_33410 [Nostoc sp. RF31YmG]